MNVLDGAHIQPPGGLDCHQKLVGLVNFPGHDGLLLIAAGHAPGDGDGTLTGADVILRNELFCVLPDSVKPDHPVFVKFRMPVPLQHQVFFQGVVQYQAVLVPVFRDMAHARFAPGSGGIVRDVPAAQGKGSLRLPG